LIDAGARAPSGAALDGPEAPLPEFAGLAACGPVSALSCREIGVYRPASRAVLAHAA